MTSTTTGQVNTTSSGQTYITGTASGLNTNALIQDSVTSFETNMGYTTYNDEINTNTGKISGYQTLQSLISNVQSSLTALKSDANATGDSTNSSFDGSTFDTKGVTYSTSDGSDASNIISATADGTSTNGSHSVIVSQLAQTMQITGSSQTSETSALGLSGSFDIGLAGNTASEIDITSSMSLEDIKNAINTDSSTSGVSADILQVSSGSYELVINGNTTDEDIQVSNISGSALTSLGITDDEGNLVTPSQQAKPAQIYFDNTLVTSTTNTFNNILTGVDLNLAGAAPDTTVTLNITNNTSGVSTALNNLITAYNKLNDYITANQQVNSDGTVSSNEVLYGESILTTLGQELNSILIGSGNNSGSVNSLGSLGITLDSNNELTISNQTALTNALNNNFSQVQSLFATQITTGSSNLTVSQNSSSLNSNFTLDITTDGDGNVTGATVNGDSDFTFEGDQLIGKSGTAYAGLTLIYTGGTSASINVTVQQGIADKLINSLDTYANSSTGQITNQITQLQSQDTTLQDQITNIENEASSYQEELINQYAQMETSIESAQIIEQQIQALLNNSSSSNG